MSITCNAVHWVNISARTPSENRKNMSFLRLFSVHARQDVVSANESASIDLSIVWIALTTLGAVDLNVVKLLE